MAWLISSEQTVAAARRAGVDEGTLRLSGAAVLTFSRGVVDRLDELCGLEETEWISAPHHPYASAQVVKRGEFEGMGLTVLVPPMGASPLACIVEDLVACGVQLVFLVCAAWSLGPPVEFGDLIIPSVSRGLDGTSIHYGNEEGVVPAAGEVVNALAAACRERGVRHHVGGNATCEALYRITPALAEGFRRSGCLCMDNGEASTLFAMAGELGILTGVLFQPYIELERGWDPGRLDERYRDSCRIQAQVVLEAAVQVMRPGLSRASGR
jgi:uridine phosphorylase